MWTDRFIVRRHCDFRVKYSVHAFVVIPSTGRLPCQYSFIESCGWSSSTGSYTAQTTAQRTSQTTSLLFDLRPSYSIRMKSKKMWRSVRLTRKRQQYLTRGQSTSTSVSFMTVTRTAQSKGTDMLLKLMRCVSARPHCVVDNSSSTL